MVFDHASAMDPAAVQSTHSLQLTVQLGTVIPETDTVRRVDLGIWIKMQVI